MWLNMAQERPMWFKNLELRKGQKKTISKTLWSPTVLSIFSSLKNLAMFCKISFDFRDLELFLTDQLQLGPRNVKRN